MPGPSGLLGWWPFAPVCKSSLGSAFVPALSLRSSHVTPWNDSAVWARSPHTGSRGPVSSRLAPDYLILGGCACFLLRIRIWHSSEGWA